MALSVSTEKEITLLDSLVASAEQIFPNKPFLKLQEVAQILDCDPEVIYNWTRRSDPTRRPPKLIVGKEVRFPKREFLKWLAEEQRRTAS